MSVQQSSLFLGGLVSSIGKILPTLPKIFKTPIQPVKISLPKLPKPSTSTKLLIGTGVVTTGVLGTELFLQTPEGQQTLDTLDSSIEKLSGIGSGFGEGVENITDFFSQNPIIIPLLLGLGIILVVKN